MREVTLGCKRLIGVHFRDDGPVQPFEVERSISCQCPAAQIVGGDQGPGFTTLGRFGGSGPYRLDQHGGALLDCTFRDRHRGSRLDDVGFVSFWILKETPGIRPHQFVLADDHGLAGPAHAVLFPLPVTGHQVADDGGRVLHRHDTCRPPRRSDWNEHPGGWLPRRQVFGEVGGVDIIDIVGCHGFSECVRQVSFTAERPGEHVGAKCDTFIHAEHHVALGVDEQGVPKSHPCDDLAEVAVVSGVGFRPVAGIAGVTAAGHGVASLQIARGGRDRQQCVDVEAAVVGALELGVVEVDECAILLGCDGGTGQLFEAGIECVHCFAGGLSPGEHNQRSGDVAQPQLEHTRPGFTNTGQPVEHRFPQ